MSQRFTLPSFKGYDKELELDADDIRLLVDYDDVPHATVRELTKLIVEKLNAIPEEEWQAAVERGRAEDCPPEED